MQAARPTTPVRPPPPLQRRPDADEASHIARQLSASCQWRDSNGIVHGSHGKSRCYHRSGRIIPRNGRCLHGRSLQRGNARK
eukprot:scaffold4940_cov46-Attheya_sp.AAC.3